MAGCLWWYVLSDGAGGTYLAAALANALDERQCVLLVLSVMLVSGDLIRDA